MSVRNSIPTDLLRVGIAISLAGVLLMVGVVSPVTGQSNSAPTADAESPGGDITISPGEDVTFTVGASDSDGNLLGAEWYLEHDHQGNTYGLEGSYSSDSNTFSFDSPGTYLVEAVVFDGDSAYSEPVEWTVTVESDNEEPEVSRDSPSYDVSATPGKSITFSVDASDDDGNLQGVEWYIDDHHEGNTYDLSGSYDSDSNSFTFDSEDTYEVEAVVFDHEDAYSEPVEWTVTVESDNEKPTISRDAPSYDVPATPGESITFSVDASDDDGNLQGVEWYIDDDHEGNTYDLSGSYDSDSNAFTFDSEGTYEVEAKAFDHEDAYSDDAATWTVTVESDNEEPEVSRESPSYDVSAIPGESVTFSVDASDDDGNLQGVEWYVDDEHEGNTYDLSGSYDSDSNSFTFDSEGTYEVEAKAFDQEDAYSDDAATWTVTIESDNEEPTISRESPNYDVTTTTGESVSFSIDASDDDGNLQGVEWYIDDDHEGNTYDLSGSYDSDSNAFTFDSEGTYEVEAKAFDQEDAYSDGTATWTVTVESDNENPTISTDSVDTTITTSPDDSVSLTAEATDPDGNLQGIEWYVNDDHEGNTYEVDGSSDSNSKSFTFESPGEYDVEAKAFDQGSKYSEETASWTITVTDTNTAPTAARESPPSSTTVAPGESISFSVTGSDPDGNLEGTEWYIDDIQQETTTELSSSTDTSSNSFSFDSTGSYTVTAKVFDSDSKYADETVSWEVSVEQEPADIRLTDVEFDEGTFHPGETLTATGTLSNDGGSTATIRAEYSHIGPTGDRVSGDEAASEIYEIGPDETKRVDLQWDAPEDPNRGQYTAEILVSDPDTESVYDTHSEPNTIKLEPTVDGAEFVSTNHESGTYEPGETLEVEFTMKNHDEGQSTYYVQYTPRGPDGTAYEDAGDHTVMGMLSGGERSNTIRHDVGDLPPGEYDGVLQVWDGRDPDTSRAPETERVIENAFTIDNAPPTEEPEEPEENEPPTGEVTINVVDQSGDPVEGVTAGIRLLETKERPVGNDGRVTFTVPEEDISYTAYFINREIVDGRKSVTVEADTEKEVTFEIRQTGTLRGTVSIGGRPVNGEIEILGAETTATDGVFRFDESVPTGRHSMKISPADSDKKAVYKSVIIEPGGNSVNWQLSEPFDGGAFLKGAIIGDRAYRQQESVSSEFMMGWMVSGTVPAADVRDTLSAAAAGDKSDTLLNLAGVVPLAGQSTLVKRMGQLKKKGNAKAIDGVVLFLQRSDSISDERVLKLLSKLNYAKEFPRSTVENYIDKGRKLTRLKDAAKTARFRNKFENKNLQKIAGKADLAELTTTRRLVNKYDATLVENVEEIDDPGYYVMHSVESTDDYGPYGQIDSVVLSKRSNGELIIERVYETYSGNSNNKGFKKLSQAERKAIGVEKGVYKGLGPENVPDGGIKKYFRVPDGAKNLKNRGKTLGKEADNNDVNLKPFDRTEEQFVQDQKALKKASKNGDVELESFDTLDNKVNQVYLSEFSRTASERIA